jgi:hypothetical protein
MAAVNVILAVYVAVDAYATIYPGSKIAANISVTTGTSNTFHAFLYILEAVAVIVNTLVAPVWVYWVVDVLRLDDILTGTSRFAGVACFGFWIVFMALCMTPGWAPEVIRISWQKIAWSHVCDGWEVDAVLTGVDFGTYSQLDSPNHSCWVSGDYDRTGRIYDAALSGCSSP